jgi:hypothetical protein
MAESQSGVGATKTDWTSQPRRMQQLAAGALVLFGLGLAGAGVAAVFTTSSDVVAAAMLGVGSVLVSFVAVGEVGDFAVRRS